MKDSIEIGDKKEKLIQNLLELVFLKVKSNSKETTAYGISKYLNQLLKHKINERTLTRYYDGYILKKESERKIPNEYNLDILSNYLGYESFKKFELNLDCEIEKRRLREEKREVEKRLNKVKRIGLASSVILIVISALFISKYYQKNCMLWVDDHYEKIRCSGLENEKRLDEVVLKEFTKIEVCKDSIFFIDGEPVIHYTRYNNNIDFFKADGEHPIYNGIFTNPITITIINSRVKPCDSIKVN